MQSGETPEKKSSACQVDIAIGQIGGKWKLNLIYHLIAGPKRYSELKRLLPGASDRMMTRSLKELETDGLIIREVFAQVPARVEYSLTPDGQALVPILEAMDDWGKQRSAES